MRKIASLAATAMLLIPTVGNATIVGFTGPYDPSVANISASHGGSVDTSAAPNSITLFGGSDDGGPSDSLYGFSTPTSGTLTFTYTYQQNDCCGSFWDPFGYTLNGVFTKLTVDANDSSQDSQSGTVSLLVNSGDVFAFDQNSLDSVSGFATTVVSEFSAPGTSGAVPEPATWALMLIGFGAMGIAMRRRYTPEPSTAVHYKFN